MAVRNEFGVVLDEAAGEIRTHGLRGLGVADIHVRRPPAELEDAAFSLLRMLGAYALDQRKPVMAGDKLSHGYWNLMLRGREDDDLDVFESNAEGNDYVRGADLTLRYWKEQSDTCRRLATAFFPPRPDQMAAVSPGVLEGDVPVWGVRYTAPPHMSGWYLTTETYSGDVSTLRVEHLYHVTALRPDLAPFLALPAGFRFEVTADGGSAKFDEGVLKED